MPEVSPVAGRAQPGARTSEREIAAILLGSRSRPADVASFVAAALHHRLAPLLVARDVAELLPGDQARALVEDARRQFALALINDRECRNALEVLAAADVPVLVIKGAHLANSLYSDSYLRPRLDTDLLIGEKDLARARAALERSGYRWPPVQTGGTVLGQMVLERPGSHRASLDLHWRPIAPRLRHGLFDFEDLVRRGVAVPRLGPHALAPCPGDALALACLHQAAHHQGEELLAWMYDVHLLIESFGSNDYDAFIRTATEGRIARVCAAVIEDAARWMPSRGAERTLERLGAVSQDEPSARLLRAGRSRAGDLLADLRDLRGWGERARLIGAHLFPPAPYMRQTYAPGRRIPLPLLYAYRAASGGWRWIREMTN
jgi:hypothetical protein